MSESAELFRRMAAGYATAIRVYQPAYDAMLALSTDLAAALAPGRTRCLDYGAGTGEALPALLAHFDRVVAIDPGPAMLAVARARVAALDPPGACDLIEGTTRSSAFTALGEAAFDAVHCSMVLMFVPDDAAKQATLAALAATLRPGGVLVLTELLVDPVPAREQWVLSTWRKVMAQRGATAEQVATGEAQIHQAMHRRTADQCRALLEAAGFEGVESAFQSLHTAVLTARRPQA